MLRKSETDKESTYTDLKKKLEDLLEKAGLSKDATFADLAAKVSNSDKESTSLLLNSPELTEIFRKMVEDYGKQAKAPSTAKPERNYRLFPPVKYTSDVVYLDGGLNESTHHLFLDTEGEIDTMICDEASINRQSKP